MYGGGEENQPEFPEMTETAEADPKTQETAEMPIPTVETPVLEADLTAVRMRAAPPIREAAPTRADPIPTARSFPNPASVFLP